MKCIVTGRKYSEEAKYWDGDKKWPYFDNTGEQRWEIEAEDLKDAEKWLAINHPDMYMGGTIVAEDGIMMIAVPCKEYGKGNYETLAARVAWVTKTFA